MIPRRLTLPLLALSLFGLSALFVPTARATVYVYSCVLNSMQENPPIVGSRGFGGGRFVIDTDANTVTYWLVVSRLNGSETGAHIHGSATSSPGTNAGVLHTLPAGNPKIGQWTYTEAQEPWILGGLCYANVHSTTSPGGEVRGQIVPLNATLDGAQEAPAVVTRGRGFATFTVDTVANVLSYYVRFDSLNSAETAAHIHGNALHGTGTGVKVALPAGSPKVGTWNYPEGDESALLAGRMYVNIHSTTSPGGEIRGQICPIVIPIDAIQESPTSGELGSAGIGLVAIDTLANTLSYDVRIDTVTAVETNAHIHGYAALGTNAGVVNAIGAGARKIGTWVYGAANEDNVLAGNIYFNSHTTNHPGGEIRGQILGLPQPAPVLSVGSGPRTLAGLSAAPNPFGGRTVLSFQLARTGSVSLAIVGVDGRVLRRVPSALFAPGAHSYEWDGRDDEGRTAAPGMYFAIVRTPDGEKVTRLARLR